jgi:hypothetical protein
MHKYTVVVSQARRSRHTAGAYTSASRNVGTRSGEKDSAGKGFKRVSVISGERGIFMRAKIKGGRSLSTQSIAVTTDEALLCRSDCLWSRSGARFFATVLCNCRTWRPCKLLCGPSCWVNCRRRWREELLYLAHLIGGFICAYAREAGQPTGRIVEAHHSAPSSEYNYSVLRVLTSVCISRRGRC